jgi:phage major head subunit gpT-like protein
MYHELKESGSTDDFPQLLGNVMYKEMIDVYSKGIAQSQWRKYCAIGSVNDFKTHDRILVGESPDLSGPTGEEEEVDDSKLTDDRYQVQAYTFKRSFSVSREVVINDDIGAIAKQPQRFGRAAWRTLAKYVVQTILGNGETLTAFDSGYFFNATAQTTAGGHGNLADTVPSYANLLTAYQAMLGFLDPDGNKLGVMPSIAVVPVALWGVMDQLVNSNVLTYTTPTTGSAAHMPVSNPLYKKLEVVVEPFLSTSTEWYLFADPADWPGLEVVFLKGKQTPDLLIKNADAVNLAGGDDPYDYYFDNISYKVRLDFGAKLGHYLGIYKADS